MSLLDLAKRTDPNGKRTTSIVELLSQSNEMLADMVFREGNQDTGHRITVRTGLPSVTWRLLNQGVTPSKSTTAQIEETTGMGGHKQRKLKIPAVPASGTYVLGAVDGAFAWIETQSCA